jgi:hypothetical protein
MATLVSNREAERSKSTPRWISILAGLWLFLSVFLWRHSPDALANGWIVGTLIIVAGVGALYRPRLRYANTALGAWMFVSALWIDHVSNITLWNHLIVGFVVIAASLVPTRSAATPASTRAWTTPASSGARART